MNLQDTATMNLPAADRWLYGVPLLALLHLLLFLVLRARLGMVGVVMWHVGPITLTLAAIVMLMYGLGRSRQARLTWTAVRTAGYAGLVAVSLMPMLYTTYPSSRDGLPSEVRFRLPLDGPVTVVWGGSARSVNYHVVAPAERWAYDLTVAREGPRYRTRGAEATDYYAYGLPVLAPAAGVVNAVTDGAADREIGSIYVGTNPCGNSIVVGVAPGEFLFLCHLLAGSIQVSAGDRVRSGQPIARVGNSGKSTEPHLHVHLQTTSRPDFGEGIPLYFHDYRREGRLIERGMPTGGRHQQIVEHASDSDSKERERHVEQSSVPAQPPGRRVGPARHSWPPCGSAGRTGTADCGRPHR